MALKDRSTTPDERRIEAIIQKGSRAAAIVTENEKPQNVQMRVLPSLLARIDSVRDRKPREIRQSRHAWIMEAVLDKLLKEE